MGAKKKKRSHNLILSAVITAAFVKIKYNAVLDGITTPPIRMAPGVRKIADTMRASKGARIATDRVKRQN
jgi:hypothetical protein